MKIFQPLSEIEPQQIEWLLPPLIPKKMMTIMEGDPGLGKSYLTTHLAASGSRGLPLPGQTKGEVFRTLILSSEDDAEYTIRPRIDKMGGNPKRIRVQSRWTPFNDEGLRLFRREVRNHSPDLIIVDPIFGYVPTGTDVYKPNEIRGLLQTITEIAAEGGGALLCIRHLTKAKRDKAIYQGAGTMDVIGAARSSLLVGIHPENPDERVLAHVKHNISARGKSLVFALVSNHPGELPILEWRGESDLTADDLLGNPAAATSAIDDAVEFLKVKLKDGPVPAKALEHAAETRSISSRTLDRAKSQLGVKSKKKGEQWLWELPHKNAAP